MADVEEGCVADGNGTQHWLTTATRLIEGYDLEVTRRLSIQIKPIPENISYLKCKKNKMGHLLDLPENTEI